MYRECNLEKSFNKGDTWFWKRFSEYLQISLTNTLFTAHDLSCNTAGWYRGPVDDVPQLYDAFSYLEYEKVNNGYKTRYT